MSISEQLGVSEGIHRLGRNLGWLGAQKVAVILLGIASTGIVARQLGPEQVGLLAAAQALVGFFGVAAMGIDGTLFTSILHREPEKESALMGGTTCVLALMGLISFAALTAYVWLWDSGSVLFAVTATLCGLRLLVVFPAPVALWFQSRMQTRHVAVSNTMGTIVLRAWQILASSAGWGAAKVALADFFSLLSIMFISFRAYQKEGQNFRSWFPDWSLGWRVLRLSFPALLAAALATFMARLDVLMLRALHPDPAQVGFFTTATSLTESLLFLSGMMTAVFSPLLVKTLQADPNRYLQQRQSYLRLCAALGWVLAIGLSLMSGFAVQVIFGQRFEVSGDILALHAFLLVPCLLGSAVQCHLTVEGLLRWLTVMLVIALGVDALLNWLLIPVYGPIGAAAASIAAAAVAYLLTPLFFPETRSLAEAAIRALITPIPLRRDWAAFAAPI